MRRNWKMYGYTQIKFDQFWRASFGQSAAGTTDNRRQFLRQA